MFCVYLDPKLRERIPGLFPWNLVGVAPTMRLKVLVK
jgi:hypothetical protein